MALYRDITDPVERKKKLIDNCIEVADQIQKSLAIQIDSGDFNPNELLEKMNHLTYLKSAFNELRDL